MAKYIIVVEDDSGILELIEYFLSADGFQVAGAHNARKFWQTLQTGLPDLIVLDIMLPDGNGVDICEELKNNALTRNIPVVLMSANLNLQEVEIKTKPQDYIKKPFDVDSFLNTVRRHIA